MSAEPHAVFIIRIAGRPGQAGVHQLRRLLKDLLRLHKFRALDVREERDTQVDIQLDAQVHADAHHPHSNLGDDNV
jgi:hypothetical protein